MAILRPEAIDDAAFTPAAQRRTAARRLSCLARNAGSGVPGRLVAWGGPAGEESCRTPLRQRRSRRSRPSARSSQERTRGTQPPDRPGDALTTGSAHKRATAQLGKQHSSHAGLSRPIPERPRSLSGVLCTPLVGAVARTPRWCCTTLDEPDPLLTVGSSPHLLWARSAAGPNCGAALAILVPIHVLPRSTRRGASRAPSVRDRTRQGRSGAAGSSEADEPGPKGDATI